MTCDNCRELYGTLIYDIWRRATRPLCPLCARSRVAHVPDDDEPDYDTEKGYRGRIASRISPATHRAIDLEEDEKEGLSDPEPEKGVPGWQR